GAGRERDGCARGAGRRIVSARTGWRGRGSPLRPVAPAGSADYHATVPPPPRVSVVVPSYNAERFLPAALDSALAQAGVALEVIVVDDGSSDGTAAILSRYADRIRVAHQDHRGPAAARNAAIRQARGEH